MVVIWSLVADSTTTCEAESLILNQSGAIAAVHVTPQVCARKWPLKQISDILLIAGLGRGKAACIGHRVRDFEASKQSLAGPQRLECKEVSGSGGEVGGKRTSLRKTDSILDFVFVSFIVMWHQGVHPFQLEGFFGLVCLVFELLFQTLRCHLINTY